MNNPINCNYFHVRPGPMWWNLVFISYCHMFVSSPVCVKFITKTG